MNPYLFFRRVCLPVLAVWSLAQPCLAATAATPWPEASFTYIANQQKVSQVFIGFARTFGLRVEISDAVLVDMNIVNGKIRTATPTEFLNQICASYGMTWFQQNGTLYVSRNTERVTRAIQPPGMKIENMRQTLIELGLFEPKFGWAEVADRGVALVSGPPSYVEMVAQAVAELPLVLPDQQIEVFRLRHAHVDDRTIQFRDRQITTPGVATILRNLISGENRRSGISTQLIELATPLRPGAYPLSGIDDDMARIAQRADNSAQGRGAAAIAAGAPGWLVGNDAKAVIQTDSWLNAVIIKDKPERIQLYKKLIAVLDVPSEQVEIEAMVVDINSSKLSQLGIEWGMTHGKLSAGYGQPNRPSDSGTAILTMNPTTVLANVGNALLARIQAMQSDGSAKIISRQPILTMDNIGAVIDTSETFYVQNTNEQSTTSVTPISVGATLKVTPHIIDDGEKKAVEMLIDIEDGAIQNISFNSLPTVRRTTIATQAVIGDGESFLIGGFNAEQSISQKDAIPILGQIPVIGALFSKVATDVSKRERMFLITPRVISSTMR
jgi:type III secretion protein C